MEEAAVAGFQAVPDLLLKNQAALELSGTDLVVLLNILMHWWYPEQKPFPRPTTIARRMGTNVRTVQRSIQQLVELGLIERVKATSKGTVLDPSALVEKLNELAEEDRDYSNSPAKTADGVTQWIESPLTTWLSQAS